jgi:hypothetical protein
VGTGSEEPAKTYATYLSQRHKRGRVANGSRRSYEDDGDDRHDDNHSVEDSSSLTDNDTQSDDVCYVESSSGDESYDTHRQANNRNVRRLKRPHEKPTTPVNREYSTPTPTSTASSDASNTPMPALPESSEANVVSFFRPAGQTGSGVICKSSRFTEVRVIRFLLFCQAHRSTRMRIMCRSADKGAIVW